MTLSTHVLDTAGGRPVARLPVTVERLVGETWTVVASTRTDADGRVAQAVPPADWATGRWRLVFDTAAHLGADAFFPRVTVEIAVRDAARHLHVPLLLSPYGFTTYRGT